MKIWGSKLCWALKTRRWQMIGRKWSLGEMVWSMEKGIRPHGEKFGGSSGGTHTSGVIHTTMKNQCWILLHKQPLRQNCGWMWGQMHSPTVDLYDNWPLSLSLWCVSTFCLNHSKIPLPFNSLILLCCLCQLCCWLHSVLQSVDGTHHPADAMLLVECGHSFFIRNWCLSVQRVHIFCCCWNQLQVP